MADIKKAPRRESQPVKRVEKIKVQRKGVVIEIKKSELQVFVDVGFEIVREEA